MKDALRAATEEAAARGVVGVPSVVVGDQVFWGDDRLEDGGRGEPSKLQAAGSGAPAVCR